MTPMRIALVFVTVMLLLAVTTTDARHGPRKRTCKLDAHPGRPCANQTRRVQRFYFNRRRGRCVPFTYYGCGGNANRFITRRACRRACRF